VIWALLAVAGVPLWLIVGALAGTLWSRRRFRAQDGVFRIAIRDPGQDSWPRVAAYGRLVRDVLIVNRGAALVRTEVYPIIDVQPADGATAPRRPERAAIRRLVVDGNADVVVAVPPVLGAQLDQHSLPPPA
jgi:hypothetical protein